MNDKPLPLRQRTVTTRTDDGEIIEAFPGQGVCDFCLSTAVAFEHDAGRTVVDSGNQTHVSTDAWNACAPCHDLIEADDLAGLAARAVEGIVTRQDEPGVIDGAALVSILEQFMRTRGESRPV